MIIKLFIKQKQFDRYLKKKDHFIINRYFLNHKIIQRNLSIIRCKETCCPNYPIKPTDACCRFKDFNFDAESVAIIV